mmetsp:Transcript_12179/g.18210  ORF Transcript_12179/g.18210 Transcript_12179/m.18210 type:complete len:95 (-) Transcript_12179:239-523(-)
MASGFHYGKLTFGAQLFSSWGGGLAIGILQGGAFALDLWLTVAGISGTFSRNRATVRRCLPEHYGHPLGLALGIEPDLVAAENGISSLRFGPVS